MNQSLDILWAQLKDYDIVSGERPGLLHDSAPWYIKIILGFSGWFAAAFLIAFIGSLFSWLVNSAGASFLLGCGVLGIAIFTLHKHHNDFTEHLGIAFSLAGQALILWGVVSAFGESIRLCALIMLSVEIFLVLTVNNFIHRIFSSFAACSAFYIMTNFGDFESLFRGTLIDTLSITAFALLSAWLWLNEFKFIYTSIGTRAVAWGVTIALVVFESAAILQHTHRTLNSSHNTVFSDFTWITEGTLVGVLIWVTYRVLLGFPRISGAFKSAIYFGLLGFGVLATQAPGIIIGLILILLGFHQQHRVLQGIGLLSLIIYLSRYYYLLEHTLAFKSAILALTGIVLLIIRSAINYFARSDEVSVAPS